VTHANRGEPRCTATWPITGRACKHRPRPGADTCDAHDPAGDRRPPPPPDEERCTATNRESGERCRLRHPPGGRVCVQFHGGAPAHIRKAAAARAREQEAMRMAATYGLPIEITPEQAILEEIHRTAGHVAWLEQQVRDLDPDDLIWGVTKVKEGGDDRGTTQEAAANIWLRLYQQERAHLAKICADAIRNGIADRQVRLAEQQGVMVAKALKAILDGLELTAAQKALALKVVPEQLRALQATALTN